MAGTPATSALSERLIASLRRFFARRAISPEDAEDLLQDCLLRVHDGMGELREGERVLAWVYRIAHNLVVDHLRLRRPESLQVDVAEVGADPDLTATVASWLEPTIADLPAPYRDVLRLSEIEGVPQREIAERLALSVSGVKSRVQRGRERLRAKLLACCELEFDRRGGIVGYRRRRPTCCGEPDAGADGPLDGKSDC